MECDSKLTLEAASESVNSEIADGVPEPTISEILEAAEDTRETSAGAGELSTANELDKSVPVNDLPQRIINQVEYYFSDENLVKDSFLMQRINKDKRGYVDLKLIASFKKMKKLTQDIEAITDALLASKKLEVDKQKTMVRRIAALPLTKEEVTARKTVVAINFGDAGSLSNQFGVCGTVTRVRVVPKNESVPSDVRKHLRRNLHTGGHAVIDLAVIEYEDEKYAVAACSRLTDSSDWRHGLHVSKLIVRTPDRKSSPGNQQGNIKTSPTQEAGTGGRSKQSEEGTREVRKKQRNKKGRSRVETIIKDESAGCSSSGSDTEGQEDQNDHVRRHSSPRIKPRGGSPGGTGSPKTSVGNASLAQSVLVHRKLSGAEDAREAVRLRSGSAGALEFGSRGISPWVQKRLEAAQQDKKIATGSLTDLSTGDNIQKSLENVNVLRQPKGPDGTRGFTLVR